MSQISESQNLRVFADNAIDPAAWDRLVSDHADGHLLQSSGWGALKSCFGWRCRRVAIANETDDGETALIAGAQVLLRSVAGLTIAYVPRGPVTDWTQPALTRPLMDAVVAVAHEEGAALLKVEPQLVDTPNNHALLADYGFTEVFETIQPPSTITLDVSGDEAAILKRMKSKWRYNIRLAKRKDVIVREASREDLPAFNELMTTTGERDGFTVHSSAYYSTAYDLFVPEQAAFLIAEYGGQPLAAIVVFALGDTAWYLWGASSNRKRNRMPNHALQWAAIQWARERGVTRYDFWGIPDEVGKLAIGLNNWAGTPVPSNDLPLNVNSLPDGELWGVYRFKQGFGGDVVRHVGAWEMPIQPLAYKAYRLGLSARSQSRSLPRQAGAMRAKLQGGLASAPSTAPSAGVKPVASAVAWRDLLAGMPDPHVLQSWEWGELKAQTEWNAERLVIGDAGGRPSAACQFLWRQVSDKLPLRVAYVPKGPVLDWSNDDVVDDTLAAIEQFAARKGCIFVKIDPDVREDSVAGLRLLHTLARRDWRFSQDQIQYKNTGYSELFVDRESAPDEMTGSYPVDEERLLAGMKSKWRYNIRLAKRRGITVRGGSEADLAAFYQLYAETAERDGFLIRPFGYYDQIWRRFLGAQADPTDPAGGALLLAEHADDPIPVAGLFLFRYGRRTWYLYGASSDRHRRDMPNHLLQFEAMRWAAALGCTVYDWWGAPTDLDDEDDELQGVWRFKQGFGAELQPHVGAWDFVVKPSLYAAYTEAVPRILGWMRRNQ